MHVSDALISPPVAAVGGLISISLIAIASRKVKETSRHDIIPLMGVLGAFVFAAQMINFTIPGTGSSGHLIGGILLSALLGPWCAFITLSSIIIVQCLVFADGGLLALGCNILNMAATSCLIAYPLVYKPIAGKSIKPLRIGIASVLSSVIGLEIGALGVSLETVFSGITALPFLSFIKFMLPIHFVIGSVEGLVTASLLLFVAANRPYLLSTESSNQKNKRNNVIFYVFGALTLIFACGFSVLASENPDGLEWSIEKVAGMQDWDNGNIAPSLIPDYNSQFSGIIGALIVLSIIWCFSALLFSRIKRSSLKRSDK